MARPEKCTEEIKPRRSSQKNENPLFTQRAS